MWLFFFLLASFHSYLLLLAYSSRGFGVSSVQCCTKSIQSIVIILLIILETCNSASLHYLKRHCKQCFYKIRPQIQKIFISKGESIPNFKGIFWFSYHICVLTFFLFSYPRYSFSGSIKKAYQWQN